MKKLFAIAVIAATLSGCTYSYDDVQESKSACALTHGEFSEGITKDGTIVVTYCTIDGVRYNYSRGTNSFFNGVKK